MQRPAGAIGCPVVLDEAQPVQRQVAEDLAHAAKEAGQRPEMLQLFGGNLRFDGGFVVFQFGRGVDLALLHWIRYARTQARSCGVLSGRSLEEQSS